MLGDSQMFTLLFYGDKAFNDSGPRFSYAPIIGCGAIVRFSSAPNQIGDVTVKSLVEFDERSYDSGEGCVECKQGVPEEHVRF
jgi:hypothetical protein